MSDGEKVAVGFIATFLIGIFTLILVATCNYWSYHHKMIENGYIVASEYKPGHTIYHIKKIEK